MTGGSEAAGLGQRWPSALFRPPGSGSRWRQPLSAASIALSARSGRVGDVATLGDLGEHVLHDEAAFDGAQFSLVGTNRLSLRGLRPGPRRRRRRCTASSSDLSAGISAGLGHLLPGSRPR